MVIASLSLLCAAHDSGETDWKKVDLIWQRAVSGTVHHRLRGRSQVTLDGVSSSRVSRSAVGSRLS
jgi:hypothetical protein